MGRQTIQSTVRAARRHAAYATAVGCALAASLALGCGGLPWAASAPAGHPTVHGDPHATGYEMPATRVREPGELLHGTRQLSFGGRRTGEGYYSADGKHMVFQSEREADNPFYQIYWMDLASGEVRRISPGVGKTTCAWIHPGDGRVLFASTHLDPQAEAKQRAELSARESGETRRYSWDYDPAYELFSADDRGGDLRQLTRALGYDAEASWSPDGRSIVFASNRAAYSPDGGPSPLSSADQQRLESDPAAFIDLYVMDADGDDVKRLTTTPGYDGGPFFSPDGERIVWRRFSEDGATAEILTMKTDGSDVRALTELGAMSWAPFYHPSGDYVVFATNLHGFANFELYIVDAQGAHEPVRVTQADGFDGLPVFSPAGDQLVWTRRAPGSSSAGSQLYIADWDDAGAREHLGLQPAPAAAEPAPPARADTNAIDVERLREIVHALASDETEGRLTGTAGEQRATAYVARAFEAIGLRPAGDHDSYFQDFEFTAGVSLGDANRLELRHGDDVESFAVDSAWRPLAFSRLGEVAASEVAFAGYGIVAPEGDSLPALDAYADLDVRGRWVLMFRYVPADLDGPARQHLQRFSSLRYKAMIARERGARGVLVVSGPTSQVRDPLVALQFDASLAGTSMAALSIDDGMAEALLAPSGHTLEALQKQLDTGEAQPGFVVDGVELAANIDLRQERLRGRNVLGVLRASASTGAAPLVIGAHVDHLGRGEASTSLARDSETNEIHYGADDNASGVAALIEAAAWLAERVRDGSLDLQRDILFAAWSGEELGLLGANHFVSQLRGGGESADPHAAALSDLSSEVSAYLNMDMVGRLDGRLLLYGAGSSSVWPELVEAANAPIGLSISLQDDAYLPTDSTIFYLQGVPILSAFTGSHAEYHTPRDTADRLDYDGLREITQLIASMAAALAGDAHSPDYVAAPPPTQGVARAGLRVYLGTVPDYAASDVTGLRLSGVVNGGPAQIAGLREGDVVVSVDGRAIENIYDYTYALEALRVGVAAEIGVLRGQRRETFTIIPTSRD